jgi:hypothetical protein
MDRRTFLLLTSTAAAGMSGCASETLACSSALKEALHPLGDPLFEEAARREDPAMLLQTLEEKGVIRNDTVDIQKLRALALSDPLVPYRDYFYTETEIQLYALASIVTR